MPKATLNPCPFCGSTRIRLVGRPNKWAQCNGCAAEGPFGADAIDASERWNDRATPAGQRVGGITRDQVRDIAVLVADDVMRRRAVGVTTYGRPLGIENGRRALQDLYDELLDAAHYCKQEMLEREREALWLQGFLLLRQIAEQGIQPDLHAAAIELVNTADRRGFAQVLPTDGKQASESKGGIASE